MSIDLLTALQPIISRVRTDISAVKHHGKISWRRNEAITEERLISHLTSGPARGVCPIKEGESTTKLALLDFDSHKGETPWEEMVRIAQIVWEELRYHNMNPMLFRSSGGHGVHLFLLWDEPQDAYSVREFLKEVLSSVGYRSGTAGVSKGAIEIFPKQDAVPIGKCGSQFILPFAGSSLPLEQLLGWEPIDDLDYILSLEWPSSPPIPVKNRPSLTRKHSTTCATDISQLQPMLDSIDPDLGYDDWVQIGMALHYATKGDDIGLELWDSFSANGSKYPGFEELEKKWHSFHIDRPRPITVGFIKKLASAGGWEEDTSADFEDITLDSKNGAQSLRFKVIPATEFALGSPPTWLIKNVLPKAGLAMVYGESGSGKTFFVLDQVAAIARGVDWRGHKTNKGRVVYIVAEGAGGFRKRLAAYAQYHNISLDDLDIGIIADAPNLYENDHDLLIKQINAFGETAVIVVDTLAQVTPGANENSGEDMGLVINRCKQLHEQTGALVILVHHSGKDQSRGARGWSGIKGALDTEIEVSIAGTENLAKITKQKDGEGDGSFAFKLKTVVLGTDEDGHSITSCAIEHREEASQQPLKFRGTWPKLVYKTLCDLTDLADTHATINEIISTAIKGAAYDPGPDSQKPRRDSRRDSARRAIDQLANDGRVLLEGDTVCLPQFRTSPQTESCGTAE